MTTTTVVKISKTEARERYESGLAIAMAGESWWFDGAPCEANVFTKADLGLSFAGLHTARGDAHYSYAAPADEYASCDSCGRTVHVDDMADLGGDRMVRGMLMGVPTECQACRDAFYRSMSGGAR